MLHLFPASWGYIIYSQIVVVIFVAVGVVVFSYMDGAFTNSAKEAQFLDKIQTFSHIATLLSFKSSLFTSYIITYLL